VKKKGIYKCFYELNLARRINNGEIVSESSFSCFISEVSERISLKFGSEIYVETEKNKELVGLLLVNG
jgi:hypothetical protein